MLKLPPVFSSGALFLQNAPLTIHGTADADIPVTLTLSDHTAHTVKEVKTTADENGHFSLTFSTPTASCEPYTITLRAADDCHSMENILFGELWLASGQSNMELENAKQPDAESMLSTLSGKMIRVYHVYNIDGGSAGMFPYEPDDMTRGTWFDVTDNGCHALISAVGTAFCSHLSDFLNRADKQIPIGFVNACWGGTGIRSWIPRSAYQKEQTLMNRLREYGMYSEADDWNTHGRDNAGQTSCQYNLKVHGLVGLRFRGILWYQGEFECWDEPYLRLYADSLQVFYQTYRELFASDEHFPMLCVLLYPFPCTDEGDCYIGYVNQNFVDAAKKDPDHFHFIPTNDLPPIWNFPVDHPIHPLHKYAVGKRLAVLAENAVYGGEGQKNPAVLDAWERDSHRLLLHFSIPGQPDALKDFGGIRIGEHAPVFSVQKQRPIGLYIAGASGTYVPADCEILSCDTVALSHPGINEPLHAVYAYNSMEEGCNLWAGQFPLGCFRTDDLSREPQKNRPLITVECKPWCNETRDAVWTCEDAPILDVFYRPVWKAAPGCEVVHDRAFTLDCGSVRIARSDYPEKLPCDITVGACVERHPYNRLDFDRYTALHLRMLCAGEASLSLILTHQTDDGKTAETTLPAHKIKNLHHSWAEYRIPMDTIPTGEILSMQFRAEMRQAYYPFVNLEGFVLMPK